MTESFNAKNHEQGMAYWLLSREDDQALGPVYPSGFISEIDGMVHYVAKNFAGKTRPENLHRAPEHDYIRKYSVKCINSK